MNSPKSLTSTSTLCTTIPRKCDACQKPPYKDDQNKPIKMLRCSRCQNAWYHDATCQRKHYKIHKHNCRLSKPSLSSSNGVSISKSSQLSSQYRCENRSNHGKCMIANQALQTGTRIMPTPSTSASTPTKNTTDNMAAFEPIVPPVLISSERRSRCSFCFGTVQINHLPQSIQHNLFHYCSLQCQQSGNTYDSNLMKFVSTSILPSKLSSTDSINYETYLTPVTILLYRIISLIHKEEENEIDQKAKSKTRHIMAQLTSNNDENGEHLSNDEVKYRQHVAQCALYLFHNTHNSNSNNMQKVITLKEAIKMTSQIIYNGFSITNGEQQTIGLGLFPSAAIINHSCSPNLVQTFSFGTCSTSSIHNKKNETPKLLLTTCQPIAKDEEMFISYMNVLEPFSKRRDYCWKEYKFYCDCNRCTLYTTQRSKVTTNNCQMGKANIYSYKTAIISNDNVLDNYDAVSDMLKCSTNGCEGFCFDFSIPSTTCYYCQEPRIDSKIVTLPTGTITDKKSFSCTSFQMIKRQRDDAMDILESISQKNRNDDMTLKLNVTEKDISQLVSTRQTLKACCHMSSWYVQESGHVLVDCLLNQINADENHNAKVCTHALSVLEELSSHCQTKTYSPLTALMNEFRIGKLLLYLYPDPCRAITELQLVRSKLLLYFPENHEIVKLVENTLLTAYQ